MSWIDHSRFLQRMRGAIALLVRDLRKLAWAAGRNSEISSYMASHQVRKLQIGTGWTCLSGWLNVDIDRLSPGSVFMDATRRFPFPDQSFDYVFSEHMIEHIIYEEGLFMLRECHRILKPGGRIRISTPNLKNLVSLYQNEKGSPQERYIKESVDRYLPHVGVCKPGFVINHFFWGWRHLCIYDPDTLRFALESAGFIDVKQVQIGESCDENLRGIESHVKVSSEVIYQFITMVIEAVRP